MHWTSSSYAYRVGLDLDLCTFMNNTGADEDYGSAIHGVRVSSYESTQIYGSTFCGEEGQFTASDSYIDEGDNCINCDSCSNMGCLGDLNANGSVTVDDLLLLIASWGDCGCNECPADLNSDFIVDVDDLLQLIAAWGPCP